MLSASRLLAAYRNNRRADPLVVHLHVTVIEDTPGAVAAGGLDGERVMSSTRLTVVGDVDP